MNRTFSSYLCRPNLPLRQPSSSPVVVPPRHMTGPDLTSPGFPAPASPGEGPSPTLDTRDQSAILGSEGSQLTTHFCNYCGRQGNFRCGRCKMSYCSVVCQKEDWNAHRHICKPHDPEPPKREKPKEVPALPGTGVTAGPSELKHADAYCLQRLYLKDLKVAKTVKGEEIKASVVEFYNPGRLYLLVQSPETLGALKVINTELQKAYSWPSVSTYVPCVGEVCGVQFSCDLNWYRGVVQALSANLKMAHILYIDFGNVEDVPLDRIRPLTPNLQPFSPCAMECRITGVVPIAGNWSSECCLAVRQMLAGKSVTAKLVGTPESGHIHMVDIQLSMGKDLSMFLIEHGYAAQETVDEKPAREEMSTSAMISASLENFKLGSLGKDDNAWAQPPEPQTQAVGDSFPAVVTHFKSPDEIIVQKVEHAGVIQELQMNLRELCCQDPDPQNFRPAPGTVCCAQFSEDKQWYRGQVLAYASEELVCVGYLDFGNSETVALAHLRPISTPLLALPKQAIRCCLAGIQPVGKSWSEDCLLALQRRVSNRILRIEIHGAVEGKASVSMTDEASDPQANVTELLISAGYAVAEGSRDQQVDQTATASVEPRAPPPACEPAVWSCTEIPCDGQTVVLLPSVVDNPGEFYCRVDNPTDHQRLIELGVELKQHCEQDDSPFEPKVGEPCCAMFPGDGEWYRAMVKELSENQVSVNLVDYGYSMKAGRHHLRSIKPRLLTLPFQAIRCWLSGVEPLGSEWSSEALLWFQALVDYAQLSARVRSVTERGYGLELESRGKNVAAALISEQLAKGPGEVTQETRANPGWEAESQEGTEENKYSQMLTQSSDQTGANSKDEPTEEPTAVPSEGPSFPVDWKTVELPLDETFKPSIAAGASPSLFYVLRATQVDQQKIQLLMTEVAAYCGNTPASVSSAALSRPAAGSACCARFSADNNWYRAVVLEVGVDEMNVIYADHGNTEKVPVSRILPIPKHLLQPPFQITRCTLTGKEHFPVEWPEGVQQMFGGILRNGVLATVQSFDGTANVLTLAVPAEMGWVHVTSMLVDALQVQTESTPGPPTAQETDQPKESSTPSAGADSEPACLQPKTMTQTRNKMERTTSSTGLNITTEPEPQGRQVNPSNSDESVVDPQNPGCCCLSLRTKIDHLERLMQQQLSLVKLLVGQTQM